MVGIPPTFGRESTPEGAALIKLVLEQKEFVMILFNLVQARKNGMSLLLRTHLARNAPPQTKPKNI